MLSAVSACSKGRLTQVTRSLALRSNCGCSASRTTSTRSEQPLPGASSPIPLSTILHRKHHAFPVQYLDLQQPYKTRLGPRACGFGHQCAPVNTYRSVTPHKPNLYWSSNLHTVVNLSCQATHMLKAEHCLKQMKPLLSRAILLLPLCWCCRGKHSSERKDHPPSGLDLGWIATWCPRGCRVSAAQPRPRPRG